MVVNFFFGIVKGEKFDQIRNGKLHKFEYYVFIYMILVRFWWMWI
jgi:hypothetical protein